MVERRSSKERGVAQESPKRTPGGTSGVLSSREERREEVSPHRSPREDAIETVVETAPIDLEKEAGARYQQLERLVMDASIPDWETIRSTYKTREVAQHILRELQKDQAHLESYHLSKLKEIITQYQANSDYRGTTNANRLWYVKSKLQREAH